MRSSLPVEERVTRRRQVRGLVRYIRLRVKRPPEYRDLIGPVSLSREDPPGICIWCGDPVEGKRTGRKWHPECLKAYTAARGRPETQGGILLFERTTCRAPGCEKPGEELDHRVALGIVIREPTPWRIVRAWDLGNLQWLCHECHAAKTGRDRKIMSAQDRAQARGRDFAAGACPGFGSRPLRRSLFGGLVRA